jgi:hypothetical protein
MTDALAIERPGFFGPGRLETDVGDGGSGADDRHIGQLSRTSNR